MDSYGIDDIPSALSDHHAQIIRIASGIQATEKVTKLELRHPTQHSLVLMKEVFQEFDWATVVSIAEADDCYEAFAEILESTMDKFVGRKVVTTSNIPRKKWITDTIKNKCILKSTMDHTGVVMGHINIRSLVPKVDDLEIFIYENNIDILAISETWLDPLMRSDIVKLTTIISFVKIE
ncbi:atp-dependent rna and dna helicase [Holotrichia oblita]|uniref:Atp-dependent rna and dna helicase n=1 Tax=Holotrichia oblita TaxID=644536 RepID=A0ACB9TJ54_HOLOL|nr:atp-dependent rna and dna helicase [Holotrichia oblita]